MSRLARHLRYARYVARYGASLWRYPFLSTAAIFEDIYRRKIWDHEGSISGDASTIEATRRLRRELPTLLEKYRIRSMLDIPCGDFSWMSLVNLESIEYTGADIVEKLVQENRRKYRATAEPEPGAQAPRRRFVALDICASDLPPADIVFCRDCLVHLSNERVFAALENIKRSEAKYLLMTTFPSRRKNRNTVSGAWRALNFERAPFHLPEPLEVINEGFSLRGGRFPDKSMALWRIAEI